MYKRQQDALAASLPNVTVFAIREVLEKVSAVLERIALGAVSYTHLTLPTSDLV